MIKTVSLDLHDFSVLRNGLDKLLTIKEHYPGFKVSLFTIPFDYDMEASMQRLLRDKALKEVHKCREWMQFIPHGATHMPREFEKCDRWTMKMYLDHVEDEFAKDDLKIEKGFCAPYWLWNKDVVDVLDEYGWWGAIDRNQPDMLKTKKTYTYTHSIDEPFWQSTNETVNLHGHMGAPSSNAIGDCLLNIMKLPEDVEWKFVSEFVV